jgi:hypothetical protein
MTTKLHVATDFTIPAEAVTQTFAILAKRGSGKTYLASVLAEEMLKTGQPVICIDPVGSMWGLRSGYPVVIFGGEHADIPLEDSAGEVVARAIVENRFPAVIDLSLFRKGQMFRFMVTFAETLYRLNREALHLFVDEADQFAPQSRNYGGDENRLLGAMEDIVRRGRKRGIGCTLITQRPAVLNKNVLTQCEVLIALRMVHPKDIDAIKEWVNVHADPVTAKTMIDELPRLPVGSAWFWSPGWGDFFRRVNVRRRETFDSGATPKPGETAKRPKHLEAVDLNALGEQIKASVEKAKADDPKELRKRIAELEKVARERPAATVELEKIVEVPVLKNGQLERTEKIIERFEAQGQKLLTESAELRRLIAPAAQPRTAPAKVSPKHIPQPQLVHRPVAAARGPVSPDPSGDVKLSKAERLILTALAQYPAGRTRVQAAVLTGYAHSGGGFNNAISSLRSKGMIDGTGDQLTATDTGLDALGSFTPLPTGPDLLDHWRRQLGKAEREILDVLAENYPNAMSKEQVAAATPSRYAHDGGGFNNAISRLRTLELISGRGELKASGDLF